MAGFHQRGTPVGPRMPKQTALIQGISDNTYDSYTRRLAHNYGRFWECMVHDDYGRSWERMGMVDATVQAG